jgi:hypothetical protein
LSFSARERNLVARRAAMQEDQFHTVQFAADVGGLLALHPAVMSRPGGFEERQVMAMIGRLFRLDPSSMRTNVRVVVEGPDGMGEVYDLGWGDMTPHVLSVPDGEFPLGGVPSAEGRLLLVTIGTDGTPIPKVRVDNYEHGMLHGYNAASPASVVSKAGACSVSYAFNGLDVSGALEMPLASIQDFYSDRMGRKHDKQPEERMDAVFRSIFLSSILPETEHAYVIEMMSRAEGRGEAVSVASSNIAGLHLVKAPGASVYELWNSDETRALAREWADAGLGHVEVRHSTGTPPVQCSLLRRVAGRLHGDDVDCPAVCFSNVMPGRPSDPEVSVRYYRKGEMTGAGMGVALVEEDAPSSPGIR